MATSANRRNRGHAARRSHNNTRSPYNRSATSTWTSSSGFRNRAFSPPTSFSGNPAPGYRQVFSTLERKIDSYRTLAAQATGYAPAKRPTPTTLSSFANWVNKGAVVNQVTPSQIRRWTGQARQFNSPGTAKSALCTKFGNSVIKAVTCDKAGNFLVATAPMRKGRPFHFPS